VNEEEKNIDKIRTLIFGETEEKLKSQLSEFTKQLNFLEKKIEHLGTNNLIEIREKFKTIDANFEKHFTTLDNSFNSIMESRHEMMLKMQQDFKKELQIQQEYIDESLKAMREIYEDELNALRAELHHDQKS
jgi:enoyl-[acyl-carrier-protein] reductase (NADH)